MRALIASLVVCAACGGGSSSPPDAPSSSGADANPNDPVQIVPCAGATIAQTITTPGFMYSPMTTTIQHDQIVHFMLSPAHDALEESTPSKFHVGFGGDQCLKFHAAGTYSFHCTVHLFTGSITAQ